MIKLYQISLLVFLLIFHSKEIFAQKIPSQNWQVGFIVLNNQDTLSGKINYSKQNDYVYFVNKNQFRVFHLLNLKAFEFFDNQLNLKRYFIKLSVSSNEKQFFETIVAGKYTLLKRVRQTFGSVNDIKNEYFDAINRYFVWDGKKVSSFQKFKRLQTQDLDFKAIKSTKNQLLNTIYFINALNQKNAEINKFSKNL